MKFNLLFNFSSLLTVWLWEWWGAFYLPSRASQLNSWPVRRIAGVLPGRRWHTGCWLLWAGCITTTPSSAPLQCRQLLLSDLFGWIAWQKKIVPSTFSRRKLGLFFSIYSDPFKLSLLVCFQTFFWSHHLVFDIFLLPFLRLWHTLDPSDVCPTFSLLSTSLSQETLQSLLNLMNFVVVNAHDGAYGVGRHSLSCENRCPVSSQKDHTSIRGLAITPSP